jgi:hypothetical protein
MIRTIMIRILAFLIPEASLSAESCDSKFLAHLGSDCVVFALSVATEGCTLFLNQARAERQA